MGEFKDLKQRLIEIGEKIYSINDLAFSIELFNIIESLSLREESLTTAFFIRADINDEKLKRALKEKFGDKIIKNIQLFNRISNVSFPETGKGMSELRKLFINLSDDLRIIFIKLAERLETLKEADRIDSPKRKRLSEECLYLYSPIAHRLGIRKIYTEMEDIAFKNLYPKDFKQLKSTIEKQRPVFEKKLKTMTFELKKVLAEHNIPAKIQSRVKRLYSIFRKIKNKNIGVDEIFDLLALRVITDTRENCYLTLGVAHNKWIPIEGRFRDWITYPKPNGYRSIQTTIHSRKGARFEIQIRTEEMHQEAEYGSAAHWAYKEGITAQDQSIMQLKEFLENDEYFENPYELLELLKTEMKSGHINVLTPRGDIKTLPEGSTPVDFAYAIHTDLGGRITGARINGKFAKLKTILKSGDVIDVISSKTVNPSRDWLNFVKTTKARSKILRWFKTNERDQIILEGKRTFDNFKRRYKKNLKGFTDESEFRKNVIKTGYKSVEDLFYSISTKGIKPSRSLLAKLYPKAFEKTVRKKDSPADVKVRKSMKPKIRIEGLENIQTSFAKCCNPLKGQPIVAYVTQKSQIKIHASSCRFLKTGNLNPDNFKKAEWMHKESLQLARLKIFGDNYVKMLKSVADEADKFSINILKAEQLSVKGRSASLYLEVEVKDYLQLEHYSAKIKLSPIIDSVKIL